MPVDETAVPYDLANADLSATLKAFNDPDRLDDAFYALAERPEAREFFVRVLRDVKSQPATLNTDQLRAFLLGLTRVRPVPRGTYRLLYQLIEDERPDVVAAALDGLRVTSHRDDWPSLLTLANHPAPEVRSAWLRYVAATMPSRAWGFLVSALRDPDPLVRENAVDELHEEGGELALPVLRATADDPDPRVRAAVNYALADLAASAG